MIKDKFFGQILISFMLCIVAAMAFKGLMYWWIPLLIMFVLIAFYAEKEAEKDANKAYDEFMRSDYYDSYEAPDETLSTSKKSSEWQAEVKKVSFCSQCGNEVYEICMCNPVKKK